jgi:hypothetical protein
MLRMCSSSVRFARIERKTARRREWESLFKKKRVSVMSAPLSMLRVIDCESHEIISSKLTARSAAGTDDLDRTGKVKLVLRASVLWA